MASPNLQAVRLEASEFRIKKMLKDIDGRATVVVRGPKGVLFVAVPGNELGWLDKVAKDIGCKKHEIAELPNYEKAPCGILTTQLRFHKARCKQCTSMRPPKPHDGESKVMAKVEGIQGSTLADFLNVLRTRMDEALALASEYDVVIKAIEQIPELEQKLNTFQSQLVDHRQALRYFAKLQ